jgi:hypothetical protein
MTPPSPEQRISFVFLATVLFAVTCFASTPEEVKVRDQWMQAHFTENAAKWPVSFRLGDKASADILSSWKTERTERKLDDQRTEITRRPDWSCAASP